MHRRVWMFFLLLVSCRNTDFERDFGIAVPTEVPSVTPPSSGDSTSSPTPVSEAERFQCPPEWFLIESIITQVGAPPEVYNQLDEDGYRVSRVPLYTASVDAFCISPFPYPGKEGSEWSEGFNLPQIQTLDAQFQVFGLRLATGSEYLAVVTAFANHRWPQGVASWEEADCDGDPYHPSVMGTHPKCSSSLGPGALLTFGFWVQTDPILEEVLLDTTTGAWPVVEEYIVMGGMPTAWQAYYGDDHWGAHQHGDEDPYFVDKPGFVVSKPWEVTPQQWSDFQGFIDSKRSRTLEKQNKNHVRPTWLKH